MTSPGIIDHNVDLTPFIYDFLEGRFPVRLHSDVKPHCVHSVAIDASDLLGAVSVDIAYQDTAAL